jgi:hypothetical protein
MRYAAICKEDEVGTRSRVKISHSVVKPLLRLVPEGGAKINSAERMSMNSTLEHLPPLLHAPFQHHFCIKRRYERFLHGSSSYLILPKKAASARVDVRAVGQ